MLREILKESNYDYESKIILLGAAKTGVALGYLLVFYGYRIKHWFDNDSKKEKMVLWDNIMVQKPFFVGEDYIIIIAVESKTAFTMMAQQCEDLGYPKYIHIKMSDICEDINLLPDQQYLELQWFNFFRYRIDFEHVRSFNEKIQWLKLNDHNPGYRKLVDKRTAKEWASNQIGKKYIIPTLGEWSCFDDVDFSTLPRKFILKCTHDSGSAKIVDKDNMVSLDALKEKYDKAMMTDYYLFSREWPYKGIERRIIAEQLIGDGTPPIDYKIMCFNGIPKCLFTCTDRNTVEGLKVTFFDMNWNELPFERHYPRSSIKINRPKCLDEMIELAKELSKNIPFVRVDFYAVEDRIFFGEMTFYPGAGLEEFTPVEWDYILGSWIDIDSI